MATVAAEFAIPAPYASSFTNGEKGVGQPSAGAGEHCFARRFKRERTGLYMIKVWCSGAGALYVGSSDTTLVKQFDVPANKVMLTQVLLPAGEWRMDVRMANATLGNTVGFGMLIYHPDRVIYASGGDGWVFDVDATVDDEDLPEVTDADLPVFSMLPNWADGITERVQYLTDIPTSETGTEQRRSIRRHPRREFDVNFLRSGPNRAWLDAFLLGVGTRKFWFPLWHEQFRPTNGVTGSTVAFPTDTLQYREFRVGDKVLLTAGDPNAFDVLTVQSLDYDTDELTWVDAPLTSWPVGSRIVPMRRARASDQGTISGLTSNVGTTGIRFTLTDPDVRFGASWGRCAPVWGFKINREEALSFQFDRIIYSTDNGVGPVEMLDAGDPTVVMRSAVLLRGRQDLVRMRRLIDITEGRAGRFYMPTGMQDIEPAADTFGGITLDAKPAGFTEWLARRLWARAIIAVRVNDGPGPHYRFIENVQHMGGIERFTLDRPLPTLHRSQLSRIEFMVPSRFDQDGFEFHHKVDEAAAVTMSVVTRSVDGTGMPPLDCYLTSRPYPVDLLDNMGLDMGVEGGRFMEPPKFTEEIGLDLTISGGTLKTVLKTYNESPEAIDFDLNVVGGTLVTETGPTQVTYGPVPEVVAFDLNITEGTLKTMLLSYTEEPEVLDFNINIIGGTLA